MSTCTVALLQVTSAGLDTAANLTNNPAIDTSQAWSPEGTRIAFETDRDGERFEYKPCVMNADGPDVTPVG